MISRNYEPIQGVNPEQETLAEWRRQCEKQNSHTHYIVSTPRLVAKIFHNNMNGNETEVKQQNNYFHEQKTSRLEDVRNRSHT